MLYYFNVDSRLELKENQKAFCVYLPNKCNFRLWIKAVVPSRLHKPFAYFLLVLHLCVNVFFYISVNNNYYYVYFVSRINMFFLFRTLASFRGLSSKCLIIISWYLCFPFINFDEEDFILLMLLGGHYQMVITKITGII